MSAASRHTAQPQPSGARPVLCPEALIDFTRGMRKSHIQLRGGERGEHRAAGAVHVQGDVEAALGLQPVERGGDLRDVLEQAGEGLPERGDHHDRVLVAALQALLGLPSGSGRGPSAPRGSPRRSSARTSPSTPAPARTRSSAARRACLRPRGARASGTSPPAPPASRPRWSRSWRCRAWRRVRGVPQVGQHPHAARLELSGLGVLVLVDDVLVEGLRQQLQHLGLHPRGAEGREVHARYAVEQQLVVHQRVRQPRVASCAGKRRLGAPWRAISDS